jgi:hypothetical protein
LSAERVAGQQQIYVKPLPELLRRRARALSRVTILGDGTSDVSLLDPNPVRLTRASPGIDEGRDPGFGCASSPTFGASWAASAFARLAGRTILTRVAR